MVPRSGCDGVVTAFRTADGPRAAGIVGTGGEAVAPPLAVGGADRVDRREVHDVEAEVGDVAQVLDGALQPAEAPREQLVPGGVAGARPVDPERVGGPTRTAGRPGRPPPARRRRRRTRPPAGPRACSSSRRTPSAAACRRFLALAPGDLGGEVLEDAGRPPPARARRPVRRPPSPRSRGARWRSDRSTRRPPARAARWPTVTIGSGPSVVVARAAAVPTPSCGRPCGATAPAHRAGRGRRPRAGPTPAPAHRPRPWPGTRRGCGGGRRRSRSASARASSVRAFGIRTAYPPATQHEPVGERARYDALRHGSRVRLNRWVKRARYERARAASIGVAVRRR